MKKLINSILLFALIAALTVNFAACGGKKSDKDQGNGKAESNTSDDSTLGDYSVQIQSCRLAKDYEGKDVVIVKYLFKNHNDDDSAAFYIAFDDTVYQNGVGLKEAYVLDDSANYNSDNQMKEIKKGASIEVEVAYQLNDTTTDIEVEVKELISFNNKTVKKTFSIK